MLYNGERSLFMGSRRKGMAEGQRPLLAEESGVPAPRLKRSKSAGLSEGSDSEPPRWQTPEFYVYLATLFIVVPLMIWCAIDLSSSNNPQYPQYEKLLSRGWLFGRQVDSSDGQYASFRNNVLPLFLASLAHLSLSHLVRRLPFLSEPPRPRIVFNLVFSLIYLWVLCGASTFKILLELGLNYAVAASLRGDAWNPFLTWALNLALLYGNEQWGSLSFGSMSRYLAWLDYHRGLMPRWFVTFNFTQLRMISYNMDLYWAERDRRPPSRHFLCLVEYCLLNFLAYALYVPLFQAGPIASFNSWMSQIRLPARIPPEAVLLSAVRLLGLLLLMEVMLHTIYVQAISHERAWSGMTPFQMAMVGYWNLKYVWLKLLIIWRAFRLWALADGVDTVENMGRCMSNNYSALGFWRAWHRSYNRWIVRYMYIPLGGAKRRALSVPIVFGFVAFWHDRTMRLLAWSWLIVLFIIPETLATWFFSGSEWTAKPYFRHLQAAGGVANIFMMMTANLVGFAVGVDGAREMWARMSGWDGFFFLVATCSSFFAAVQLMLELRHEESRRDRRSRF